METILAVNSSAVYGVVFSDLLFAVVHETVCRENTVSEDCKHSSEQFKTEESDFGMIYSRPTL